MVIKKYFNLFSDIPLPCWLGAFYFFCDTTLSGIFYFFALYFHAVLHFPLNKVGWLIGSYSMGAILGGYMSGRLTNHIAPQKMVLISVVLQSIFFFMFNLINDFYFLFPIIFILGMLSNTFITANNTWVLQKCSEFKKSKTKVMSLLSTGSNLGLACSALLASTIIPLGWNHLFKIIAIAFLALAVCIFFDLSSGEKPKLKLIDQIHMESDLFIMDNQQFYTVLISLFLIGMIIAQMSSTYSLYLQEKFPALGIKVFSYLFLINTLMVVFCQQWITVSLEHFNKLKLLAISSVLFVCGFFILIQCKILGLICLAMVIYTLGEIIYFTFSNLYCYELAPANKKGRVLGLYRTTYAASRVAGAYLGGEIYHYFNGDTVFYFCCLCSALSACILLHKIKFN